MIRYPFRVQIENGLRVDHAELKVLRIYETFDFELQSMTRAQFQQMEAQFPNKVDFQNAVLDQYVLKTPALFQGRPFVWDDFYAGLAAQVYQKILTLSGFIVPGGTMDMDMIEPARQYLTSEEAKYDLLIMTAFPQYKLEDLLNMDPQYWHRLIGMAEAGCRIRDFDPELITNPGNIQRKQALARAEAEAGRQLQMMMTRRDGSVAESKTDQMVFTAGG